MDPNFGMGPCIGSTTLNIHATVKDETTAGIEGLEWAILNE